MKKYILFFISIGLIIITFFISSTIKVEETKKVAFTESGYILDDADKRYYFSQNETYTSSSYDDKITFIDAEGAKVTLKSDKFIHYSSGNITALQDSVLLDLNRITDDTITYYNVSKNKEIKKLSNRYVIKNLNSDIQFEQAIWKISPNKYIIIGKNIKVMLNNGVQKTVKDYIEIEYSDNEIINIYNQEVKYQTISSNAYIELSDGIKVNLDTKIVSKDSENKMSLEDMIINSDDNVTLIDINQVPEDKNNLTNTIMDNTISNAILDNTITNAIDNTITNAINGNNNVNNTTNNSDTTNNNTTNNNEKTSTSIDDNKDDNKLDANTILDTIVNTITGAITDTFNNANTNNTTQNTVQNTIQNTIKQNTITNTIIDKSLENQIQNTINLELPEIKYEPVDDNETRVDETVALQEPIFKLENMKRTAVGFSANVQIEDENDLISKNSDIIIKVVNNATDKIVYLSNEPYGSFNIPINIETLIPNTQYTVIVSANYIINDKEYSKNFINRAFVTSSIGVEIEKDAYTDSSLSFNISITDPLTENLTVELIEKGNSSENPRSIVVRNTGEINEVLFDNLKSDTEYTVKISQITYDGVIQEGANWTQTLDAKTLKEKIDINSLNYSLNKRDGTIKLIIDNTTDKNNAIQSYKYTVYKLVEIQENGEITKQFDLENPVYEKETTEKEITIEVGEPKSNKPIVRNQYYGFKIIATMYDNEKYVEVESQMSGAFSLNGIRFPTVKFERTVSEYPATEIQGWLYILDNDYSITVDNDNPIDIMYSTDVEESKLYKKIRELDPEERITDSDGNKYIKLWIDLGDTGSGIAGLREETSYNFTVYATVDLQEKPEEESEPYKNIYIGSFIATTGVYSNMVTELTTTNIPTNAFTVELGLEADDVIKESISSINIMLYEGSGNINVGEYRHWTRTITKNNYSTCKSNAKYDTDINSLQDLLFNNKLIITPSFVGGGTEDNYSEVNYQIVVTAAIDGTLYSNKIPIVSKDDNNDNTGNVTYIDRESGEKYSSAYIIVDGKGTTASVPTEGKVISAAGIKNANAIRYGLEKKQNLDNETLIAYYVSTNFANTGSLIAKEITYYVWDEEENPVLDGNNRQLTKTVPFVNQEAAPAAIFELKDGTLLDKETNNATGMHRGLGYFFSYTIKYLDVNGNDVIWPISESDAQNTYTNKSLKTENVYPEKQVPKFEIYPKTSDETSLTYVYSCSDYDKALKYYDDGITYINLVDQDNNIIEKPINVDEQMNEIVFNNLELNKKYSLKYLRKLNESKDNSFESARLVTHMFEGVINLDNVIIQEISYNIKSNPGQMKIYLSGNNLTRIAAVQVTFEKESERVTTDLVKLKNADNRYYIDLDIIDLIKNKNFIDYIGVNLNLKLTIYYDNGVIGFEKNNASRYATYVDGENNYLRLDSSTNNFMIDESIKGNVFEKTFEKNGQNANLTLKTMERLNNGEEGVSVDLSYSSSGFKQNGLTIIQKELIQKQLDDTKTVNIKNVGIGIEVTSIKSTVSTANIKTEFENVSNFPTDKIVVELWHSPNKNDTPVWSQAEQIEISTSNITDFDLINLLPLEYYYMKLKYIEDSGYSYVYDIGTREYEKVYKFETLATIGINNVKVEYNTTKYSDKYLSINYKVDFDKSNLYNKMKYVFYNNDGATKINLSNQNIIAEESDDRYSIVNGALIVNNLAYSNNTQFEEVLEKINISQEKNVFTMNKKYIIEITPIITSNEGRDIEIEKTRTQFQLSELSDPTVGLKMSRRTLANQDDYKYIRATISIIDKDSIIYGSDWGEYELHIYKYKNSLSDAVELNYYSSAQGGTNLKGTKFNLREHATNFSVYLQKADVDYTYNYLAEIVMKYDKENKGISASVENKQQFLLKAIDNTEEVSIGTVAITNKQNNLEIRFYDSYYNIDRINKIEYTIYEMSSDYNQSASFVPQWRLVNDEESGISYYKINTPIQVTRNGVYDLKMNLYVNNSLVEQIDTKYIYE